MSARRAGRDDARAMLAPGPGRDRRGRHRDGARPGRRGRRSMSSGWPPSTGTTHPDPWKPPDRREATPAPEARPIRGMAPAPRPKVERATGPVDVIHATTIAIPPRSAPLVVTIHDLAFLHDPGHFTKRGVSFLPARPRARAEGRRPGPLPLDRNVARLRGQRLRRTTGCASSPWASTVQPVDRDVGRRGEAPVRTRRAVRAVDRNDRAAEEPPPAAASVRRRSMRTSNLRSSVPRGGTRTSAGCSTDDARQGARLRAARRSGRALRGGRGLLLPQPLRGVRLPRARGDGPGNPRGHVPGHVDRGIRARCFGPRRSQGRRHR